MGKNRPGYLKSWQEKNVRKMLLYFARNNAKKNKRDFSLVLDDIPEIPIFCPVFPWIRIEVNYDGRSKGKRQNVPSLDRINNNLGYVKGNVRVISVRANKLKSNGVLREFKALAEDAMKVCD